MCATSTAIAFAGCTPFLAFRVAVLTASVVAHTSGGGDMSRFRERWKSRGRREVCSPCHGEGTVSPQHVHWKIIDMQSFHKVDRLSRLESVGFVMSCAITRTLQPNV